MLMSLTRTTYHESSYTLRKVGLPSAVLRVPTELTLDQQIHSGGMMAIVFQDELFLRNLDTFVSCPLYAIKTHSLKGRKKESDNAKVLASGPKGARRSLRTSQDLPTHAATSQSFSCLQALGCNGTTELPAGGSGIAATRKPGTWHHASVCFKLGLPNMSSSYLKLPTSRSST